MTKVNVPEVLRFQIVDAVDGISRLSIGLTDLLLKDSMRGVKFDGSIHSIEVMFEKIENIIKEAKLDIKAFKLVPKVEK